MARLNLRLIAASVGGGGMDCEAAIAAGMCLGTLGADLTADTTVGGEGKVPLGGEGKVPLGREGKVLSGGVGDAGKSSRG